MNNNSSNIEDELNGNNNSNMDGGRRRRRHTRKMRGGQNNRNSSLNNNANNNSNQEGGARAKIPAVGSHAQVWHGTAKHTSGGLTKKDLMKNKRGKIISRKKHALGKKALKHLVKAGFKAKKGTFKLFKK